MGFENSHHHHRWILAGSTIDSDVFSMVFPILRVDEQVSGNLSAVGDGFPNNSIVLVSKIVNIVENCQKWSKIVNNCKNCKNCLNCQKLFFGQVMSPHRGHRKVDSLQMRVTVDFSKSRLSLSTFLTRLSSSGDTLLWDNRRLIGRSLIVLARQVQNNRE